MPRSRRRSGWSARSSAGKKPTRCSTRSTPASRPRSAKPARRNCATCSAGDRAARRPRRVRRHRQPRTPQGEPALLGYDAGLHDEQHQVSQDLHGPRCAQRTHRDIRRWRRRRSGSGRDSEGTEVLVARCARAHVAHRRNRRPRAAQREPRDLQGDPQQRRSRGRPEARRAHLHHERRPPRPRRGEERRRTTAARARISTETTTRKGSCRSRSTSRSRSNLANEPCYIRSGASIPSSSSPCCSTLAVTSQSASRALRVGSSERNTGQCS